MNNTKLKNAGAVNLRTLAGGGFALLLACVLLPGPAVLAAGDEQAIHYRATKANTPHLIDGIADNPAWAEAQWYPVDQRWLGPEYSAEDFSGRFKVNWTEHYLYVLFQFNDDVLIDTHHDPLVQYWDDDTLEVFIDEDRSGGNHQFNHNAFAYHMALDNQAIDIGTDRKARAYNSHVRSAWRQYPGHINWELAIKVFPDNYKDDADDNEPVRLEAGKILGFMVAYCDNDGSEIRENFIGSIAVSEPGTDRGWIDADVFGGLLLVE